MLSLIYHTLSQSLAQDCLYVVEGWEMPDFIRGEQKNELCVLSDRVKNGMYPMWLQIHSFQFCPTEVPTRNLNPTQQDNGSESLCFVIWEKVCLNGNALSDSVMIKRHRRWSRWKRWYHFPRLCLSRSKIGVWDISIWARMMAEHHPMSAGSSHFLRRKRSPARPR